MMLKELKLEDDAEFKGIQGEKDIQAYLNKKYNRIELQKIDEPMPESSEKQQDHSILEHLLENTQLREMSVIQGAAPSQIHLNSSLLEGSPLVLAGGDVGQMEMML